MTVILDVAVGLVFVYLVLSLLSSTVAEALEHYFHYRADYLRQGVEKLLLSGDKPLREALYEHPLIASLSTPSWWEGKGRSPGPAYIPSRQFVLALLDVVTRNAMSARAPAAAPAPAAAAPAAAAEAAGVAPAPAGTASVTGVAQLLSAMAASEDANAIPAPLAQALRTLIADAGNDMEKVKTNVQQWFDGSMDRVSAWYKRHAQFLLLLIGTGVAVGVNVDTLTIVHTLSNDSAVRAAVVAAAETYARENPRGPGDTSAARPPALTAPQGAQTPPQSPAAPPASNPPAGANASGRGATPPVLPGVGTTPQGNASGDYGGAAPPPAEQLSPRPAPQDLSNVRRDVQTVVNQLSVLGLPVGWRYFQPGTDLCATKPADGMTMAVPLTGDERRTCLIEQRVWPQWSGRTFAQRWEDWRDQFATHLLGWLLTAFALSFGAPFWFDTLNKIMVVRSTVKPREKSREEASEDRQRR